MSKRFSDAELACEWWRANLDLEHVVNYPEDPGTWDFKTPGEDVRREKIIHRFATLPHAQDEPKSYKFSCNKCEETLEADNAVYGGYWLSNHQAINHPRPYRTAWEPR